MARSALDGQVPWVIAQGAQRSFHVGQLTAADHNARAIARQSPSYCKPYAVDIQTHNSSVHTQFQLYRVTDPSVDAVTMATFPSSFLASDDMARTMSECRQRLFLNMC